MWLVLLLPVVYLLVSLEIVKPRKSLAAFRALMRPFPSMAELMVIAMKVARERLSAHRAGVVRCLALCCSGDEIFRQVTYLGMERSCMSLQIFRVGESFSAQAVWNFALERPFVDIDVSIASLVILEAL